MERVLTRFRDSKHDVGLSGSLSRASPIRWKSVAGGLVTGIDSLLNSWMITLVTTNSVRFMKDWELALAPVP